MKTALTFTKTSNGAYEVKRNNRVFCVYQNGAWWHITEGAGEFIFPVFEYFSDALDCIESRCAPSCAEIEWLEFFDADCPFKGGRFGTSDTYQQQRIKTEQRTIDRKRSGVDAGGNAYYTRMLRRDADLREWSLFMECN